jgi:putative peptidoglycan lipid II flippase
MPGKSMGQHREIARAAGVIGGATLVSRLLGYVRDMVMGSIFGAGLATDAFIAAYRIPNYLRRIFGEGTLNASFVPVFTEILNRDGREKAWELANVVITMISSLLTLFVILGMVFTPGLVRAIAPGFTDVPQFTLTVLLTRVTFPFAVFVGLSAAFMGILNSLKHFGAPAAAPALLNVSMILSALFLSESLSTPVLSLSIGVLLGGFLQLLVQIPFLIRKGFRFAFKFDLNHSGMRRVFRLMVPGIIGQSVLQINLFVGTILASLLPAGSITYLFFADRLVQFPLALFGISVATAMLPTLSAQASEKKIPEMLETLSRTMRMVLFFMIPSMIGLIVLKEPIVSTLFQRGSFDYAATRGTALALMYYSLGLWAFAEVRVVAQPFYAMQDTKTPMKVAVIALLVNLFLSLILMSPLKHGGLALANALASILNLGMLAWILRARVGPLQGIKLLRSGIKILLASLVMGVVAYYGAGTNYWEISGQTVKKLLCLSRGILFGVISYFVMCLLLRVDEFKVMRRWMFKSISPDFG